MRVDGQQTFSWGSIFGNDQENYREATVTRERQNPFSIFNFGQPDKITIDAGSGDDKISVKKTGPDAYEVDINGQKFTLTKEEMQNLTIKGGSGNDSILIDPSVDVAINVDGGSGNDQIRNFADGTNITGGSGNDVIASTGDGVSIDGGSGNDAIVSTGDNGRIAGGSGDDWVSVMGDNNVVRGGAFERSFLDLLFGFGSDSGNDKVQTNGSGNDVR